MVSIDESPRLERCGSCHMARSSTAGRRIGPWDRMRSDFFWVLFFPPKNREKSGQTSLHLPAYGSLNGETIWEHEVLCHWMLGVAQFRNSLRRILNSAAILIGTSE